MSDPFTLENETYPPVEEQLGIIFAFKRVVLTQVTDDAKEWQPKRILAEMWRIWDGKPRGAGQEIRFRDKYTRRISDLRRDETSSVEDALLYYLIEAFVVLHANPENYVAPGRDISLINDTASKFDDFCYGGYTEKETNDRNRRVAVQTVKDYGPYRNIFDSVSLKPVAGLYVFALNEFDFGLPLVLRKRLSESPVFQSQYLAVLKNEQRNWPAVLFDKDLAYYELGFYHVKKSAIYLRSIAASPLSTYYFEWTNSPAQKIDPLQPTFTARSILLHSVYFEGKEDKTLFASERQICSYTLHNYFYMVPNNSNEIIRLSRYFLNFLDRKQVEVYGKSSKKK